MPITFIFHLINEIHFVFIANTHVFVAPQHYKTTACRKLNKNTMKPYY